MVRLQACKQASKQASKKTDFTVDLIWWGSLRLAPTRSFIEITISERTSQENTESNITNYETLQKLLSYFKSSILCNLVTK